PDVKSFAHRSINGAVRLCFRTVRCAGIGFGRTPRSRTGTAARRACLHGHERTARRGSVRAGSLRMVGEIRRVLSDDQSLSVRFGRLESHEAEVRHARLDWQVLAATLSERDARPRVW